MPRSKNQYKKKNGDDPGTGSSSSMNPPVVDQAWPNEQQSDNNAYFGSMYHMRMICFLVYMML